MAAFPDTLTTQRFMGLLLVAADAAGIDVGVQDAAEAGWLTPEGEALAVTVHGDLEFEGDYLITVRKVA